MDIRELRQALFEGYRAGVRAVDPVAAVKRTLRRRGREVQVGEDRYTVDGTIHLIGIGKAAHSMTLGALDVLGELVADGLAVTDHQDPLPDRIRQMVGDHPYPSPASLAAGEAVLEMTRGSGPEDLLIALISGGGSSLVEVPRPGLSLDDLVEVQRSLGAVGAPIRELNTVRRHLSALKNGGVARAARRTRLVSIMISDVGDAPASSIASGPTLIDGSTPADARTVLRKYLPDGCPKSVMEALDDDVDGGGPTQPHQWLVVADGALAAKSAREEIQAKGLECTVTTTSLSGEASTRAGELIKRSDRGVAVLAGETTVTGAITGLGGRNQEAALAAAMAIDGREGWAFAALGTDGIDGPTDAAGAIVDGSTLARGVAAGSDPVRSLNTHNSFAFLRASGDLVRTGPTGTNVGDLWFLACPG